MPQTKANFRRRLDTKTRNKLIDLVGKYPELYGFVSGGGKNIINRRKLLWIKIGEKLSLPDSVCREKFNHIKDTYRTLYKQPEWRNGTKRSDFYDRLHYLGKVYDKESTIIDPKPSAVSTIKPEVVERLVRATNRPKKYSMDDSSSDSNVDSENDDFSENIDEGPITSNDNTQSKRHSKNEVETNDAEINNLDHFFANVEHLTRQLSIQLQLKVKRMISDVIYDAEEQWINDESNCNFIN